MRGLPSRPSRTGLVLVVCGLLAQGSRSHATSPPKVEITPARIRIQIASATLAETLDALSRAAGFKIAYEGARPSALLHNTEIDTETVAEALSRLLEGQNLNYAVMYDLTGRRVANVLMMGAARTVNTASPMAPSSGSRPQPFGTPRTPRNDLPPVDDDPAETVESAEVAPEPTPSPVPTPSPSGLNRFPGAQGAPPFTNGAPFGPRPRPTPPPPVPTPSP